MQLVAYGAQDIYLTGNPQITFFKVVYRRHTNFSMETISQTLDGNNTLSDSSNNEATCTIARNGDLIHKMYITSISSGIFCGSKIINSVELEIGGQKIDKHTEEWNNVWNELSTSDSKSDGLKCMQGDDGGVTGNDTGLGMIQIPLNFWFCRNPGLALPLIALQYHEVKINFVFGKKGEVSTSDSTTPKLKFYVDYIYLDTDERRRFAQVSHEYLIEQVQMQSIVSDISQDLIFNHPVKELIWTTEYDKTNNYDTAILKLNGHDRFEKQEEEYFQLRQPFDHHTKVPRANLTLHNQLPRTHIDINILDDVKLKLAGNTNVRHSGIRNDEFQIVYGASGATSPGGGGGTLPGEDGTNPWGDDLPNVVYCFSEDSFKAGTNLLAGDILLFIGEGTNFGPFENQTIYSVESELTESATSGDASSADTVGVNSEPSTTFGSDINLVGHEDNKFFQLTTDIFHTTDVSPLLNYQQGTGDMITLTAIHKITKGGHEHEAYTSKLTKKINVYSFALKPEEHQPSGTCNFSRIDTATLEFGKAPTGTNNIYAVNYNVLRIMSGMGGLAYSN